LRSAPIVVELSLRCRDLLDDAAEVRGVANACLPACRYRRQPTAVEPSHDGQWVRPGPIPSDRLTSVRRVCQSARAGPNSSGQQGRQLGDAIAARSVRGKQALIDKLTHENTILRRLKFAVTSEKFCAGMSAEQKSLIVETLDTDIAELAVEIEQADAGTQGAKDKKTKPWWPEQLCSQSSRRCDLDVLGRVPLGLVSKHRVQYRQQLAHAGHDRDLLGLAGRDQAAVENFDRRVEAHRRKCGHVQHGTHLVATTPDPALPLATSRIVSKCVFQRIVDAVSG